MKALTVDDLTDERADDAYEAYRQRQVDAEADAADALRAHEEAVKRQQPPIPQPCHACTTKYAGCVCPICKEERPAFTALKRDSQRGLQPLSVARACRYFPNSVCGCGERGECVPAI